MSCSGGTLPRSIILKLGMDLGKIGHVCFSVIVRNYPDHSCGSSGVSPVRPLEPVRTEPQAHIVELHVGAPE